MDCSLSVSPVHGDCPGKNTGVGCHFLFQGIFPTQGSNPHLLHWQVDSLPLSQLGSPHKEDKGTNFSNVNAMSSYERNARKLLCSKNVFALGWLFHACVQNPKKNDIAFSPYSERLSCYEMITHILLTRFLVFLLCEHGITVYVYLMPFKLTLSYTNSQKHLYKVFCQKQLKLIYIYLNFN